MTASSTSIGARIVKGTFWTVSMRMAVRMLGVVSVIILARILTPDDYGIVAQAVVIHSLLEAITQFGLENALIQNQRATRHHYDTAWTIHVARGGAIAALLAASAVPAAVFFREPRVEAILYFYSLISLASGLTNIGIVDFRKQLLFHLDFRYHLWRKLVGFVATIGFALYLRNYWAFVAGSLVSTLIGVALSFYMSSFRPRLSLKEWRSLFGFSKWVLPAGLITSVSAKIDTFILGRMAPTEQLGLYTVSHEVAGAPSSEIAMPIGRAMMPGLATVNDDLAKFRALYAATVSMVLMVALPAALGLSAVSTLATDVLLGAKWLHAAPVITVLALFGIGRVMGSLASAAYFAYGRVSVVFKLSVLGLLVRGLSFGWGYWIAGFWGVVWGAVIGSGIMTVASMSVQSRTGLLRVRTVLADSWRILIAAVSMWMALRHWDLSTGLGALPDLLCSVLTGAAIYMLLLTVLWLTCSRPNGPERRMLEYLQPRLSMIAGRFWPTG